jgi:D-alanyl-D-alanine carboxypeptidase
VRRRRFGIGVAVASIVVVVGVGTGVAVAISASAAHPAAASTVGSAPPPTPTPTPTPSAPPVTPAAPPAPTVDPSPPAFDKAQLSIDDPASYWTVVNKQRPIADAADFVPPDLVDLPDDMPNPNGYRLRAEPADALETMFHAAKDEIGVQLVAQSGYRSYGVQVNSFQYYVDSLGVAGAELTSARPGFSEHQTGLAMDILDTTSGCSTDGECFAHTAAGQWLAANAWRFGYLLRYPADKTEITGYEYEPWHFRYVGIELATELHTEGVETLEEFFGLPPAPSY